MSVEVVLFLSICLLVAAARLMWINYHTSRRGMFAVRKKRGNRKILYMRPSQCPVGDMAAAQIFIAMRIVLRELRDEGFASIFFESHMVRKENFDIFHKFLKKEGMRCEDISYRKTLWIHSTHLKIAMFISHRVPVTIHSESARITIRPQ
ncbi:hypothetical protein IAQ00_09980 [Pantoea ananatis]|uniref:hypothetical protein n=1 Tax=Pantoea ananas TaxID=553 RepID=UPI00207A6B2D|nr:hypothetical protein [Pantoea ananatis]MCW0353960.1 hypothetical protein [Pantoea ananatis]USL60027.1 hypothetical protein IAQ00_09980 [Pantoea ananatis]